VTGAWGWAIVLLTIVVKAITLPLTLKQMSSMKAMKRIQPEIVKIKEKYGDDKVKQGQEMQALFGRAGVNPLAGCLPMLVQMPVWFALYSMLAAVVELVHESFLWLPDLTKQDPYYALPIALGAMMVLQNRMMPSGGDEAQQKMMRWVMPIVFSAFMLFLPSGLGVYIFVNIVLSVIQTAIQVGRSDERDKATT
jgi:YidC/Oxa1 family membrane protein insertase